MDPLHVHVKEYWKNPRGMEDLVIYAFGGREGDFDIIVDPANLRSYVGREVLIFATVQTLFVGLDPVWLDYMTIPIVDGEIGGVYCLEPNGSCRVPLLQFRMEVFDALASGRPYAIPQAVRETPSP